MLRSIALILTTSTLLLTAANAQTAPAARGPATAPPAAAPSDLKIALMDGSILTGKLSVAEIAIDTKFGPLKVPVTEIQSMMPGLQSHPKFAEQLTGLINDLAADAFADREKADQALRKMMPDIRGELQRQLKTAEAEKQNRLQKILDESEDTQEEDADKEKLWVKDDVIITPGFTVVGRITTSSFTVASPYGTLQVKLEDVRQAWREGAEPEDIRKTLAVTGTSLSQRAWVNSNIKLAKGDRVFVTAGGTIQMTPWGGNQTTTPDGANNFGTVQPNIFGGTLIGRIGEGGPIMRIGSKSEFTATMAGTLQFGVAVNGDYSGNNFPGEFQVKVRIVKKK